MIPSTPMERALAIVLAKYPDVDSAEHWVHEQVKMYLAGRAEALEEAAKLCDENAKAYQDLQKAAWESNDLDDAKIHLCEKMAAQLLAREVRALGRK